MLLCNLLPEQIYEIFKGSKVSEDVFIFVRLQKKQLFFFKKYLLRFCLLFFHSTLKITRDLGVQKLNFDFKFGFFPHCLASKVVNSTGCFRPSRLPYNFWSRRNSWWLHVWKNQKNLQLIFVVCCYRLSDYWYLLHRKNKLKIVGNQ